MHLKNIGTYSDIRIKFISDIVNGIKTIKAFWWEEIFKTKVDEVRNNQLSNIFKSRVLYSIASMLIMNGGFIATIVLFGYQWGMGIQINYSSSFIALLFAGHISFKNLVLFLQGLNILLSFLTIWSRADEIMNMDEHINENKYIGGNDEIHKAIICENLIATWGFKIKRDIYTGDAAVSEEATNVIQDITFDADTTDFIAIVGTVGSGKSSLLAAIMSELKVVNGSMKTRGRIAYVEQEPFIMSASVKDNITFGLPFDESKFNNAIEVCWLEPDIQSFENGIETQIGERGINISGGQKARVSLARAVYSDADIYLLDDPLSALDHKVGKEIFEKCITGKLSSKWVVMATHQPSSWKEWGRSDSTKEGWKQPRRLRLFLMRERRVLLILKNLMK